MLQLLKPTFLELVVHNTRSHGNEKPTHRNEEQPLLAATRESLRAATKTQHSQNKLKKKNSSQPLTCPGIGLIPHLILTLTICIACMLSHVQLFATTWTTACQIPLFMGFSRQEYWSWLPPPGGSSQPRDRTHISCIGRWFLYHCVPWEAQPQVSGTSIIFIVYCRCPAPADPGYLKERRLGDLFKC